MSNDFQKTIFTVEVECPVVGQNYWVLTWNDYPELWSPLEVKSKRTAIEICKAHLGPTEIEVIPFYEFETVSVKRGWPISRQTLEQVFKTKEDCQKCCDLQNSQYERD